MGRCKFDFMTINADVTTKQSNHRLKPAGRILALAAAVLLSAGHFLQSHAAEPVDLQITEVAPVRFERRGNVLFADFGKAAFGNLRLDFRTDPPTNIITVRLGEKLSGNGTIDRKPPGSVNYREITLATRPGQKRYQLEIPSKQFHLRAEPVKMPANIGEVTVFRYVEIEGAGNSLNTQSLRQLFVHAPFDDNAAHFKSSDETLNAVWELCKYTMKATTAFGVYIDGERERIPYEADAYINQLSHYACDLDPRVARFTVDHLLKNPTWPTEWSLHMPMMAWADYEATGDPVIAATHYEELKKKLLREKARGDGLLRAWAIVDWPGAERDGYNDNKIAPHDSRQIGPEINTVVNAFYYHALRRMAGLARALKKDADAAELESAATRVYETFNRVFFDSAHGLYIDGEGSRHASLHANMFPLAFGLVPKEREKTVVDFVQSRGMACSVYGAQYLLEALFNAGRGDAAIQLMTSRDKRSWWHMIELGSTMTLEAWDAQFKPNLTWNHAWGAVPANIITRFVLGVRPLSPGYSEMLIAPELGRLKSAEGKVPTQRGPVNVKVNNGDVFKLEVRLPSGAKTRVQVPLRPKATVLLNGKKVEGTIKDQHVTLGPLSGGKYVIESR
jgi:Glycogen debranching enzyme